MTRNVSRLANSARKLIVRDTTQQPVADTAPTIPRFDGTNPSTRLTLSKKSSIP